MVVGVVVVVVTIAATLVRAVAVAIENNDALVGSYGTN
jgi:hypothetical protein